jgi:hypothetical protein
MANTVNVTTENTFEEWRVKTNELGTATGDLDNLTTPNTRGTNVISALTQIDTDLTTAETTLSNVAATYVDVGGDTMTGDLDFNDNVDANFGTGADLKITHNGTNTSLTNITGQLRIGGNDIRIQSQNHSEDYILCVDGGAVKLYYNDSLKLETTNTGINVTGTITSTGAGLFDAGVYASSGETLDLGVDSVTTIQINDSDKIGIGTTPHATYKVDVSGQLNATDLSIGGESLDDRFMTASTSEGTTTITDVTSFTNDITMSESLTLGTEKIYQQGAGGHTFTEFTQDAVGSMLTGNTETFITVTYDDTNNEIDYVVPVKDEDDMTSDSATHLATQQSIKKYVDDQVTAQDLDVAGDSGTGAVDLDSQSLTIEGTTNEIETSASNQTITIGLPDDVTISGNLTVSGTTTSVNTATMEVEDPLLALATGNDSADAVDIGLYGLYDTSGSQDLYGGLFRDASDGKWKLFKDNQAEPTTTVNVSGTGYAVATLVTNIEGDVTGDLTGDVTGDVTGDLTGDVTGNVTGDLTGDVTGDVTGDLTGDVTGNVTGNVTGAVTGAASSNLLKAGGEMTGNITMSGTETVDGRDLSADGTILDAATDANTASAIVKRSASGDINFTSGYVELDGSNNALMYFRDNDQSAWRQFGWIDGSEDWHVHDADGTQRKIYHEGNLPTTNVATSGTAGTVKIGYSENGKNYPLELSSDKAYVNVPWTDTVYSHPDYTTTNINTSGATIIDLITTTNQGHISAMSTRTLTLADLGYTGATNANYITNNNQLTNGAGYVTAYTAGNGLTLSGAEFKMSGSYTGTFTASGDVVAYSDDSLKTNVQTIDSALSRVEAVRGVTFERIADGSVSTGVMASELEAVLPEAVHTDEHGVKGVAYGNITGLLIEAIKELTAKVEDLENR